jgi:hypothetical protein
MNTSGEVADQVVRMTLSGVEVLLRISGSGASKLAGFLYAALKDQKKTKGRTRLESMLKSGKPLEVFSIKQEELRLFTQEAKRYGILYCGLKSKLNTDGMCDIMVRSEDAAKLNRIVEKLQHGRVDIGSVVSEIQKPASEKEVMDRDVMGKDEHDIMVDKIFEKPSQKEQAENTNPTMATTKPSPPSEPISKNSEKQPSGDENRERPSVRKELSEIQKGKSDAKLKDKTTRSASQKKSKSKSKKSKSKSKEK